MILSPSLVGGWEKLELWDHTPAILLGLLFMVCTVEVVVWNMTNTLFLRSSPFVEQDADYNGSDEYEDENIYYEHLTNEYDRMIYRMQRQQQRLMEERRRRFYEDDDLDGDESSRNSSGGRRRRFYPGHSSAIGLFRFFN